jgi:hypothetical protein
VTALRLGDHALGKADPQVPRERWKPDRGELRHAARALALLAATVAGAEAVLWIVAGLGAAAVGAAAAVVIALAVARYVGGADAFDSGFRRPIRLVQQREPSLRGWATAVDAALASGIDFERLVRPGLERLYAVRLAERHGVSLHTDPNRAAELIGPEVWPWIDPQRPHPSGSAPRRRVLLDRRALETRDPAPPPPAALEAIVRRLETL